MLRGRLARHAGRLAAFCLFLVGAITGGCGSGSSVDNVPTTVAGIPRGRIERPSTPEPILLADQVALGVDRGLSSIVAVRTSLRAGCYDLVTTVNGAEFSRRRIERIGENLTLLPLPMAESASLSVHQSPNSGPLDVDFLTAEIVNLEPESALGAAASMASRFESETGQLADPAVDNLVPNASFAADDEVRGTPADWFAYVETTTDSLNRRLQVSGVAPGRRPLLATGPMRVEPGRRYRVLVRLEVREGVVVLRIADYEELRVLADLGNVAMTDGSVERRIEFTASPTDRAARIRFEPATAGERVDFVLTAVQMELLP